MKKSITSLGLVALALAGCSLTNPVVTSTPQGPITCELVFDEIVWWDRAISYPSSMSEADADEICVQLGRERSGGDASAPLTATNTF